jgi:general secretion pathway protein D
LLAIAACQERPATQIPPQPVMVGRAPQAQVKAAPTVLTPESGRGGRPRRPVGGIYPGNEAVLDASPDAAVPVTRAGRGEYTLSFDDANIADVVKSILGDTLGETYVLDPRVQGKATLQSGRPLSRSGLIFALEQMLSVNGAALLQQDGIYRIVPADEATRGAAVSVAGAEPAAATGAAVSVAPLRYISAAEMLKIVQPFVKAGTTVQADPTLNVLVIGGERADRRTILDLVRIFDVDWLQGMSFGLFPIETTSARLMAEDLQRIFLGQETAPEASLVRFVPIERLNAVLVVAPSVAFVDRAHLWIGRLDVGEYDAQRIFVYPCQYARAEELAAVLSQVFGTASANTADGARLAPGQRPTEIRSGITGGLPGTLADAPGGPLRAQVTPGAGTAGGSALRQTPFPAAAGGASELAGGQQPVKIIPDPVKKSLVILATANAYQLIESALRQLDVESTQVLVEATFIEVTLTDDLELSTQWAFDAGNNLIFFPVAAPASAAGFFNWLLVAQGGDIRVALRALQTVTDVNVLSSPNLLVLDNQQARIQVGNQVPVLTQQVQQTTGADTPIVSSVEYRDTGTILNLRPRVNASGLVNLEIQQEVSNVAETTSSTIDSPTFNQRSLQSTVAVHDGESIVLGGLIESDYTRASSGLPWLAQIPVIGFLFGTQQNSSTKRELIVIITPSIARGREQARDVTENLEERMLRLRPTLEQFRIRSPERLLR